MERGGYNRNCVDRGDVGFGAQGGQASGYFSRRLPFFGVEGGQASGYFSHPLPFFGTDPANYHARPLPYYGADVGFGFGFHRKKRQQSRGQLSGMGPDDGGDDGSGGDGGGDGSGGGGASDALGGASGASGGGGMSAGFGDDAPPAGGVVLMTDQQKKGWGQLGKAVAKTAAGQVASNIPIAGPIGKMIAKPINRLNRDIHDLQRRVLVLETAQKNKGAA